MNAEIDLMIPEEPVLLIQDYDPAWEHDFRKLKRVLVDALQGLEVTVEHVGSTAVPGLAAKPIIDIDIVYSEEENFAKIANRLSDIGYSHNGEQGIPGREAFKRNPPERPDQKHALLDTIRHHLYACHSSSAELHRHILFRDALKADPELREQYQALKRRLAAETDQDHRAYAALKELRAGEFILSVVRCAEEAEIE